MLLSLIAMLAQGYDIQVVLERTYESFNRRSAQVTVLTDANLVAGFIADLVGNHGELFDCKPFIWEKGKLVWLPLGRFEHGHVQSGNDRYLVGSVSNGAHERAAKWTRDPKKGWAAASWKH